MQSTQVTKHHVRIKKLVKKMVSIRKICIEDLDQLIALLMQLWPTKDFNKEDLRKVFEKGLKSDNQMYLGAEDQGRLIGYGSVTIKNNLWVSGNLGNVDELIVDSEYRNRGIGKLLMNELEKIALEHKCKRVELESSFHRIEAHKFYERLGFKKRAYFFSKLL